MHKEYYASGFLYHSSTQQILLQQIDNGESDIRLSLFTGKSKKDEDAASLFQRIILETLSIKIPLKDIHPIYDYEHETSEGDNYIVFAEINDTMAKKIDETSGVQWLLLKKLPKVKLSTQIRQDIIVGQRVINLIERQRIEGEIQEKA